MSAFHGKLLGHRWGMLRPRRREVQPKLARAAPPRQHPLERLAHAPRVRRQAEQSQRKVGWVRSRWASKRTAPQWQLPRQVLIMARLLLLQARGAAPSAGPARRACPAR